MMVCRLLLLCSLAAWAEPSLRVVYTGRLAGYARACAQERFVFDRSVDGFDHYRRECPGGGNALGAGLLAEIGKLRQAGGDTLVVGAGDHFALDFAARTAVLETRTGKRIIAKDELLYREGKGWILLSDADPARFSREVEAQGAGNSIIDGEAVAGYLAEAGYDVVVPGKHDFYFGAERLRQVSRWLASQPKPVEMLAANLIIRGVPLEQRPGLPERLRRRNYTPAGGAIRFDVPAVPLPWLRRVAATGVAAGSRVVLCRVGAEGEDHACPAGEAPLVLERSEDGGRTLYTLPAQADALRETSAYHVCVAGDAGNKPVCALFRVAQPFFQYGAENTRQRFPKPYFVDPERNVVVLGAVLPGLEGQIGLLNTVWRDPARKFELRAVTTDAIQAVEQLLDYCAAKGDCPAGRRRVLVAQMPMEAAAAIQRRLRMPFDLVVTDASSDSFTPFPSVTYPPDYPALLVSPKPPYSGGKLSVHAQWVRVGGPGGTTETGTAGGGTMSVATMASGDVAGRARKALATLARPAPDGDGAAFRALLLEAMLAQSGAQVALVQRRDLFSPDALLANVPRTPASEVDLTRAVVDNILWKGDFLTPRLLRGAALRRALERSREFDTLDQDVYFRESDSHRGLEMLGVFFDSESRKWIVDGAPLMDERPYLVAMTDFLAFGDTGYPELAREIDGAEPRAADLELQPRLSELVLDRLRHPEEARPKLAGVQFGTYMDYLAWPSGPEARGATLAQELTGYFATSRRPVPRFPGPVVGESAHGETLTQVRPRWRVALERGEVAWSAYRHNQGSQTALLSAFEGITESRVNAPESQVIAASWALEARRDRAESSTFFRTEGRLRSQRVENSESRFVFVYPQNEVSVEAGWRRSLARTIFERPWWSVVVSGIATSQPQNPLFASRANFIAAPDEGGTCPAGTTSSPDGCRGTLPFEAQLGRTTRTLGKLGIRREGRASWGEAGVFTGHVRRPESYQLEDRAPCALAYQNLRACLEDPARLLAERPAGGVRQSTVMGGGMESGAFFNVFWRMPLDRVGRVQLVLENRGRYYFRHGKDIPLDTQLSNLFTAGLSIPVAGRLAIKPGWTMFHFRNKPGLRLTPSGAFVDRPPVLLLGNGFDMQVEYRFDWRQGQSWKRILRYGDGR